MPYVCEYRGEFLKPKDQAYAKYAANELPRLKEELAKLQDMKADYEEHRKVHGISQFRLIRKVCDRYRKTLEKIANMHSYQTPKKMFTNICGDPVETAKEAINPHDEGEEQ